MKINELGQRTTQRDLEMRVQSEQRVEVLTVGGKRAMQPEEVLVQHVRHEPQHESRVHHHKELLEKVDGARHDVRPEGETWP